MGVRTTKERLAEVKAKRQRTKKRMEQYDEDIKQLEKKEEGKRAPAGRKPRPRDAQKPRKKYEPAPPVTSPGDFEWQSSSVGGSFEDMMSKFKRTSEDKMSDLKRGESRGYSRRGNGGGRK